MLSIAWEVQVSPSRGLMTVFFCGENCFGRMFFGLRSQKRRLYGKRGTKSMLNGGFWAVKPYVWRKPCHKLLEKHTFRASFATWARFLDERQHANTLRVGFVAIPSIMECTFRKAVRLPSIGAAAVNRCGCGWSCAAAANRGRRGRRKAPRPSSKGERCTGCHRGRWSWCS